MVEAFAGQGARVAFVDIDDERLDSAGRAPLRQRGTGRSSSAADLTDIDALRAAIASSPQPSSGRSRVLVNNAANDERHDGR